MVETALQALRWIRRGIIFVVGATVTLFGLVLIFTPGPAIIVVPVGLAILATEFAWAGVILRRVKAQIERLKTAATPGQGQEPPKTRG